MSDSKPMKDTVPSWAIGDPLMEWYASQIWGKKVTDDDQLFEIMSLQVFQAGLTWKMVLARRDAFRNAFHGWNIQKVAEMGPVAIDRLLTDKSIIRNGRKIDACINNARTIKIIQRDFGSFCGWFYSVMDGPDLKSLQSILKQTFVFMGPEIARMWLMASGRIPSSQCSV